tara:strand:- start:220 stop:555 length:336 start_codon:yes stop_codon:yes gene_type:complete
MLTKQCFCKSTQHIFFNCFYLFINVKLNKNTTIIILVTNLDLDINELKQMNQQVNVSIGSTIKPFNTLTDGDIFYSCSTREIKKKFNSFQLIKLFKICSDVIKNAIINSIK